MTLFPGLPGWANSRKVKPIWILLKQETASGSGISWAMYKYAPTTQFFTGRVPFLPPNQRRQKHRRRQYFCYIIITVSLFYIYDSTSLWSVYELLILSSLNGVLLLTLDGRLSCHVRLNSLGQKVQFWCTWQFSSNSCCMWSISRFIYELHVITHARLTAVFWD